MDCKCGKIIIIVYGLWAGHEAECNRDTSWISL